MKLSPAGPGEATHESHKKLCVGAHPSKDKSTYARVLLGLPRSTDLGGLSIKDYSHGEFDPGSE